MPWFIILTFIYEYSYKNVKIPVFLKDRKQSKSKEYKQMCVFHF